MKRRLGSVRTMRLKGAAPGRSKYGAARCWIATQEPAAPLTNHQALILRELAKGLEPRAAAKAALAYGHAQGWTLCDSTLEATHYRELLIRQRAGEIRHLTHQVSFGLHVNGVRVGGYVADFVYHDAAGQTVVVDTKGVRTELYRWKKKHFEAEHGLTIRELRKGSSC